MYIYTKSNIIVSYTPQGIFTTGKWMFVNVINSIILNQIYYNNNLIHIKTHVL